jgi:hypothetical protein
MPAVKPWSFRGTVFRSYCDELRRAGVFEKVRAGASSGLAALLDDPGRAPSWMGPAPFDEIMAAVCALRGREGVRELGYHVMKSGFTKVLEPIIHLSLSLMGASPASLLSRAHLMLSVVSRGVEMTWTQSNAHRGTMLVRCEQPIPEITWAGWEGCFLYGLELARASGTVSPARAAADGRSCEIDVSWTMK